MPASLKKAYKTSLDYKKPQPPPQPHHDTTSTYGRTGYVEPTSQHEPPAAYDFSFTPSFSYAPVPPTSYIPEFKEDYSLPPPSVSGTVSGVSGFPSGVSAISSAVGAVSGFPGAVGAVSGVASTVSGASSLPPVIIPGISNVETATEQIINLLSNPEILYKVKSVLGVQTLFTTDQLASIITMGLVGLLILLVLQIFLKLGSRL